jgi:hypothetical protein
MPPRHGVAPNQLFTWRRLVAQGALTAAGSGEEVVPASDYRALQSKVRELQRLLCKKSLEAEILKEAFEHATGSKKRLRLPPSPPKDGSPMKTVAEVIGVSRSNLIARMRERPKKRIGRPPLPRRQTRGRDQGGHRRAANLRLPTCPRHPQAPSAGRFFLQHPASKLARR